MAAYVEVPVSLLGMDRTWYCFIQAFADCLFVMPSHGGRSRTRSIIRRMVPLTVTSQVTITIFVPLAVGAFFTFLSVSLSSRNASKNAQRQNDLAAKLKLAEFRQAWINELRDSLSRFQSQGLTNTYKPDELSELYRLAAKIRLLMNKSDPHYSNLSNSIDLLLGNSNQDGRDRVVSDLTPVIQTILKTEWEVLKRDLSYEAPIAPAQKTSGKS